MFCRRALHVLVVYFYYVSVVAEKRPSDHVVSDSRNPIVTTNLGQLRGVERETSLGTKFYSFKGIPYAEPPVGSLRFKDPQPAKPWPGIRDAINDGHVCSQYNMMMESILGEEDCLFLNVYTPSLLKNTQQKLPVMIHIHGGGFYYGSSSETEVNPENFIQNDIVFVAMNYRLGIFGFLSLDIEEVPGNAALKDQLLAIKWVNQNIEYFGGDVNDITIHGISAGAASVEFQILNTKSESLFHRAILQSGASLVNWARPRKYKRILKKFSAIIGSKNEPREILKTLNNMTAENILNAEFATIDLQFIKDGLGQNLFLPVIEKEFPGVDRFLKDDPLNLLKSKDFVNVPTLTTFCRDEGKIFRFIHYNTIHDIYNRKYADFTNFLNVSDKHAVNSNLTKLYSAMNVSLESQGDEFLSDIMFLSGIYQRLKYLTQESQPHFAYMFDYINDFPWPFKGLPRLNGTLHVTDGTFMTMQSDIKFSSRDFKMKEYLVSIHSNFVKNGNPTVGGSILWNPITKNDFVILNINGKNNIMTPFPFGDRMRYWDTLYH